ncbi:hypothetical protein AAC387_Pa03g2466 [Persea americana]
MCPHRILISTDFSRVGKETHLYSTRKIHQAEIWLSFRSVYSQVRLRQLIALESLLRIKHAVREQQG